MRDGWRAVLLREVAEMSSGKHLKRAEVRESGPVEVLGANGRIGFTKESNTVGPVTLVGRVGAIGAVHPLDDAAWVTDNVLIIRGGGEVDPRFLSLLLTSVDYEKIRSGTNQPLITQTALGEVEVAIPPKTEQRRIADLLAAVDLAEQAATSAARSLDELSKGLVQTLVAQSGARSRRLGEISKVVSGGAFPRAKQGATAGEVAFLKVSDMNLPANERAITVSTNWLSSAELGELKVKCHPAGTVIFPKVGAALKTEKRRLLKMPAAFDNNVMGLVPSDEVLPEYLLLCLELIKLSDHAQEGAVPSVNKTIVEAIEVIVPDIDRQAEIVSQTDAVIDGRRKVQTEAAGLVQLHRSLSVSLLSGDHEIPESYDRLLEGREDDDSPPAAVEEAVAS